MTTVPRERFGGVPADQLARLDQLGVRQESLDDAIGLAPFDVLGDIGIPEEVYRASSLDLDAGVVFASAEVLRIW